MASDVTRFTFTAGRTPDDTFAVVDFQLTQSLSSLFRLELTLASSNPALEFRKVLDQGGTLIIRQGEEIKRRLRGIVTFCEQGNTGKHQTLYHITLRPELCRSFQNVDIRAIFQTLLKETGVLTHDALFRRPHPFREFCVQYQETDFDFIARLAAEEGIFFCEEEYLERNLQKLTFADDSRVLRRLDPLPYNPNGASESSRYCINSFCRRAQIRPAQVTTRDYTFKAPLWPGQFNHRPSEMPNQRAVYEIFDYPGRFKDAQRGADFAKYQVEGWRSDVDYATGTSNSPRLQPGRCFSLTDHPRADLNDLWQVVACTLTGSQPQALTGSEGQGTTLTNSFSVIPAVQTWRSQPPLKPRVDGPPGEEIFCDEHGRVRVKFAWDRYNQADAKSSCWIRVSQAWAGAGFGNIAIPRVGQEVIVDFLNGDPDQPIITGRTYHAGNRAPGDLPGTRTQMAIRSQTYKGSGYNELMFEDETNQELLSMHAQKDMKTVVLNNRDTEVKADHTETIGNNQSITVALGQTVTVGKENAAGHDTTLSVAHDRQTNVGNDQTLRVAHDRTENVGHDDALYVANDRKITVKGKQAHTTTGDHVSLVKGKYSLEVKDDLAQKIAGALGIDVQGDIVLKSHSKITLQAGGSFIVIHPAGIDITGPKINLNGGGTPGTLVPTLQPVMLSAPADGGDDGLCESQQDGGGSGGEGNSGAGNDSGQDEPDSEEPATKFLFS
ncbi:type VI secretion system tip protein TssI/VgrG [Buttiauxella gaviniae]|uniref:Type VI secretion system tip protein TssI/VgrG n=1 Tax=Buttiauxella gaviniae TaxID=82990 RepID=A0ABV3NRW5_9ENTR